jgi:hypothetical protein
MVEDSRPTSTAPGNVAVAVVHEDPPRIFVASDEMSLSRLLAVEVVCEADPDRLDGGDLSVIRSALMEEDWASAVAAWIEATGVRVDVHPDEPVTHHQDLTSDDAAFDIRLSRLFEK